MTSRRPEIAYLAAAVVLAIAACVLAALHDVLPGFLPLAVVGLLSAGAGITLPTAAAAITSTVSGPAAPQASPPAAAPVVDTTATF